MCFDFLISGDTSFLVRGNDEYFALLREDDPHDGDGNVQVPCRLFAERGFRIAFVGSCDLDREDRGDTPQASVIGTEIGSPPNGCIRGSGGIAEAHPGLVRSEDELRMTTDPRAQGNDDVRYSVLLEVSARWHEQKPPVDILETPHDLRPGFEPVGVEPCGRHHLYRETDGPRQRDDFVIA